MSIPDNWTREEMDYLASELRRGTPLVEIANILKKDVDETDILSERMDVPGLPRWNLVRHIFQDAALGSAATTLMIDAFDHAMERLGYVPGKSCIDAMAGRIVEAARTGERDMNRLGDAALTGLRPKRRA